MPNDLFESAKMVAKKFHYNNKSWAEYDDIYQECIEEGLRKIKEWDGKKTLFNFLAMHMKWRMIEYARSHGPKTRSGLYREQSCDPVQIVESIDLQKAHSESYIMPELLQIRNKVSPCAFRRFFFYYIGYSCRDIASFENVTWQVVNKSINNVRRAMSLNYT